MSLIIVEQSKSSIYKKVIILLLIIVAIVGGYFIMQNNDAISKIFPIAAKDVGMVTKVKTFAIDGYKNEFDCITNITYSTTKQPTEYFEYSDSTDAEEQKIRENCIPK